MCKCTPEIRTPWCGKLGCETPTQLLPEFQAATAQCAFEVKVWKNDKEYYFNLNPTQYGKLWITNELGEGMEIDAIALWKHLNEFWHSNF